MQVCGVFLILVSGAHTGMYWGLQCYPVLCSMFISSYWIAAVLCVLVGNPPSAVQTTGNKLVKLPSITTLHDHESWYCVCAMSPILGKGQQPA